MARRVTEPVRLLQAAADHEPAEIEPREAADPTSCDPATTGPQRAVCDLRNSAGSLILRSRLWHMIQAGQAISDLKFSDEMSWASRFVLQLLSEVRHVNANVVG